MPIPAFDRIRNVLPPHAGDPTIPAHLSPYRCTMTELCQRLSTSAERRQILTGFLLMRQAFFALGVRGFQWIGGSFVEDIESQESRCPGDIDVVTFVGIPPDRAAVEQLKIVNPWLIDHDFIKGVFQVDHYLFPLRAYPTSGFTRQVGI